jgi:hypothetical protein
VRGGRNASQHELAARGRKVVTGKAGQGGVAALHLEPTEDPMTKERMALAELLQKSGDGDFLRSGGGRAADPDGGRCRRAHRR